MCKTCNWKIVETEKTLNCLDKQRRESLLAILLLLLNISKVIGNTLMRDAMTITYSYHQLEREYLLVVILLVIIQEIGTRESSMVKD